MSHAIKVSAPATISNINCGYDVLGLALDITCDEIIGQLVDKPGLQLKLEGKNARSTPADPKRNTVTVAIAKFLEYIGETEKRGMEIRVRKSIYPGSGLGSSAASACAGVFLANELLGRPMEKKDLLPFAILGEYSADSAFHADNVAPCLIGGIVLIRDLMLLDVQRLPTPPGFWVTLILPEIQVLTKEARSVLKENVPVKHMIKQTANLASFVHALQTTDFGLMSRSLQDHVIERQRAHLVPGFYEAKEAALNTGALGCGLSGSGPTMFVLSNDTNTANAAAEAISAVYKAKKIECKTWVSAVNQRGTVLM